MLDRSEVTLDLLRLEFELQVNKIRLVELYLEAYEHTCDPLESVRIIQMIADTMAQRPRIDLEANYFEESYRSEIDLV